MAQLKHPIERNGEKITEVSVTEPTTGALRGIKLVNLLQMDVATLAVLLPRITTPALLPEDVAALKPVDFMKLANEVISFFVDPAELEAAQDQAGLG